MKRRAFITLLGGAAAPWPLAARAQQTAKVWRIGMLETIPAAQNAYVLEPFRQQLRQIGYVEGQNYVIENTARQTATTSDFLPWSRS